MKSFFSNRLSAILTIITIVLYLFTIIAFIWYDNVYILLNIINELLSIYSEKIAVVVITVTSYFLAYYCEFVKIVSLNASRFTMKKLGVFFTILFTFLKYLSLTVGSSLLSLLILEVWKKNNGVNSKVIFFGVLLTLLFALVAFVIEGIFSRKLVKKIENDFSNGRKWVTGIYNGLKHLEEIRDEYNIEKVFSIFAVIATILILGDTAGLVAYPLSPVIDENTGEVIKSLQEVYLESINFVLLLPFIAFNISYLFEMLKKGIKN